MNRALHAFTAALVVCFALLLSAGGVLAGPLDRTPNPNLRRLYRFGSSGAAFKRYVASPEERFQFLAGGFIPESVLGHVRVAAAAGTVRLHGIVLANGEEVLTIDENEVDELRAQRGSTYRGVLGHVYPNPPANASTAPLYRLYSLVTRLHLYTSDPAERDRLIGSGYFLQQRTRPAYVYLAHDLSDTRPLYIAPIHERAYTDGRTLTELRRMQKLLAPDGGGPSVQLGWSKSYWYLRDGGEGPVLTNILDLARAAPIPLVLILNGGRWMADNPEATRLDPLRQLGESVPLYRVAVPNARQVRFPLYTTRASERDSGGIYEGIVAGVYRSQVNGTVPLYRVHFRDTGNHFYTTNESERAAALGLGAIDEGVTAYVFREATSDTVPFYRLYNPVTREHVFTTSAEERAVLLNTGAFWDEGIACHVHPYPLTTLIQTEVSVFGWNPGKQFVCLSRLNRVHYRMKREALLRASQRIVEWARANPSLLVAVSIDPETLLNDDPHLGYADYNPMAIMEWHQWLSNTGIYDPAGGEYRGQGRKPAISVVQLAITLGKPYRTWADVRPPRTSDGTLLWRLWRDFSRAMVRNHNQDMADWVASAGIPRDQIFAHQTPNIDPEHFGDVPDTAILNAPDGTPLTGGITAFGAHARQYGLFAHLVSRGIRHWGLFEYNPTELGFQGPVSYQEAMSSLIGLSASDVSIIAPYKWPVDEDLPGAAIEGTPFQPALADFIRRYGNVLR